MYLYLSLWVFPLALQSGIKMVASVSVPFPLRGISRPARCCHSWIWMRPLFSKYQSNFNLRSNLSFPHVQLLSMHLRKFCIPCDGKFLKKSWATRHFACHSLLVSIYAKISWQTFPYLHQEEPPLWAAPAFGFISAWLGTPFSRRLQRCASGNTCSVQTCRPFSTSPSPPQFIRSSTIFSHFF